jgi:thioredoxin reductase
MIPLVCQTHLLSIEIYESYVGYKEMYDYLLAYADKHQLMQYVRFNTKVISIDDTFTVTYRSSTDTNDNVSMSDNRIVIEKTDEYIVYAQQFDAICVANGHYSEVYMPDNIRGQETHTFPICHSRVYRTSEPYRNQCVVVVGASHSGIDICGELVHVAKQVVLSMKSDNEENLQLVLRTLRLNGKSVCTDYLSSSFSIVPPIDHIDHRTVYFENQTSIEPDSMIFCTGYQYRMSFLHGKLQVDQHRLLNNRYVLFKQMFHADFSSGQLSFLAIPYRIVPFPLAELQSHLVARVLSGQICLPEREQMINEIDDACLPRNRTYHCVDMIEYTKNLLDLMNESNRYYPYRFTIDDQRRLRKINLIEH